ncbi:MAG TPA: DUF402 domain-containing protein [Dehalococcoidia bacterium]|nr:DUF402 domain-containing protein [Dehalococcoidia bacterium]
MQRFRVGRAVTIEHLKPWRTGRPIRQRGTIVACDDESVTVRREFRHPGQRYDSLDAKQRFGDHGTVELRRGAWVSRRRYFRKDGTPFGDLYNIQTPTEFRSGLVRYVDLEIDVSCEPGSPPAVAIHDAIDLDQAIGQGHIPAEIGVIARDLADRLADLLSRTPDPEPELWDMRPNAAAVETAMFTVPDEEPATGQSS